MTGRCVDSACAPSLCRICSGRLGPGGGRTVAPNRVLSLALAPQHTFLASAVFPIPRHSVAHVETLVAGRPCVLASSEVEGWADVLVPGDGYGGPCFGTPTFPFCPSFSFSRSSSFASFLLLFLQHFLYKIWLQGRFSQHDPNYSGGPKVFAVLPKGLFS